MSHNSGISNSDLPEDRSTVLLLGVTRIPTSPAPVRRPSSLPLAPNPSFSTLNSHKSAQSRRSSFSTRRQQVARRHSSVKRRTESSDKSGKCAGESPTVAISVTPSNTTSCNERASGGTVMDRSVDSIGTCSLDVDASAELSDWSAEASSVGTLRSASIKTPSTPNTEPHLPSYLSLACTVNGYSTTTNYDPVRLARSRDNSPHRFDHDNLTPKNFPTYSIHNNLLSPPNLVPLPTHIKPKMSDRTVTQHHYHRQFYSSTKTTSSTLISSNGKDTVDACVENGHGKSHAVSSCETKSFSSNVNGETKCSSETTVKEYSSNATETKSFIQQRVERLYGPGALAQGFFVMKKRQTDNENSVTEEQLNGSLNKSKNGESPMKQSTSSPALPVLRHLRPEFRAQLPIVSPKKGGDGAMQKSNTVPELKEETKVNGHSKQLQVTSSEGANIANSTITEESGEKDGHYFLKILQNETNRILKLADNVETILTDEGLSEEIVGKIHSVSGKARLLVTQKMQQFKGLCTNNITQSEGEAFPTTNEDLQGFWDMVMLQVDQVDALFKEIDVLKANNWQEVERETNVSKINTNGKARKVVNRARNTSAVNEEARKQREAQRKKIIEERRKAMKAQSKPVESIEIFVPESS